MSIAKHAGTDVARHAAAVLRYLMLGAEISELQFCSPKLLLSTEPSKPKGQPYINLASRFKLYETRPVDFPLEEADVDELTPHQERHLLVSLRHKTIVGIEVLEPFPHLVLTFGDGTVLYLNGHNVCYEAWQAGLLDSDDQMWLVVAGVEDQLAIFAPDVFWRDAV
jgi:hypothetical protein